MGDLVQLPTKTDEPPPKLVRVCECGCTGFHLYADGSIECTACYSLIPDDGEWMKRLPAPPKPEDAKEATGDIFKIVDLGSAPVFVHRKSEALKTAMMVGIVDKNGDVSCWVSNGIETADQKSWLQRRMDELKRIVGLQ